MQTQCLSIVFALIKVLVKHAWVNAQHPSVEMCFLQTILRCREPKDCIAQKLYMYKGR